MDTLSSLRISTPGASDGASGADPELDPAAPLVSTWQVRAEAGEAPATVRVRNLESIMIAGRDAWAREGKPQPVLLSSEVAFARPFETSSARDAVNHETVHYGNLAKTLLRGMRPFSKSSSSAIFEVPRTADVFELLWVRMTGRVVDGSRVGLPPDQVPFLDVRRLSCLGLTLHLPKASLLGSGVSLTTVACFKNTNATGGERKNPWHSYSRSLRLHSLHVPILIGVNSNERCAKQMVVVDVEIDRFDVLEDIHADLERLVVNALDATFFETLEALATFIARKILNEFRIGDSPQLMKERGWQVRVCLAKPIAIPFADCPSVEVCLDS